jgi:hypothetical protein
MRPSLEQCWLQVVCVLVFCSPGAADEPSLFNRMFFSVLGVRSPRLRAAPLALQQPRSQSVLTLQAPPSDYCQETAEGPVVECSSLGMDVFEAIRDKALDPSQTNDQKFIHYDDKVEMYGVQVLCPQNDEMLLAYHLWVNFTSQEGPKLWQFRIEPAGPLDANKRWLGKQRMRLDDQVSRPNVFRCGSTQSQSRWLQR